MNNLESMKKRLTWHGGNQEQRMIKDKYRTLQRVLKYSYQGCDVKKLGEDVQWRVLINPDKEKTNYDDKMLSIDYAAGFKAGDIFEWINTGTKWLVYLPHLTEDAYFRSEIRRCKWQIKWVDEDRKYQETWCYIRGPVETKIDSIQKSGISVDVPNWSLDIYMPDNPKTRAHFKRYTRFLFDDIAWEVQVVDRISIDGVLQIVALEYFNDIDKDDIEDNVANAFKIIPERETINDDVIVGEGLIKPKRQYKYSAAAAQGKWFIKESRPVTILSIVEDTIILIWSDVVSGSFTLCYEVDGTIYEKQIVVESLF